MDGKRDHGATSAPKVEGVLTDFQNKSASVRIVGADHWRQCHMVLLSWPSAAELHLQHQCFPSLKFKI